MAFVMEKMKIKLNGKVWSPQIPTPVTFSASSYLYPHLGRVETTSLTLGAPTTAPPQPQNNQTYPPNTYISPIMFLT